MNYVIEGVCYHVDTWGNGYPLLLLHGFTGNGDGWKKFEPKWKDYSYAIALDIIGHGKTESPADLSKYDINEAASALNSLLDEMGIDKTDILGYSMGGRLAITFAVKYPNKVRRLILESSSPGLETEEERADRRIRDNKLSQFIENKGIEEFVRYWEDISLFQSQQKLPEKVRQEVRQRRLRNSPIGLSNSLKGMGTGSQPSWWNEIQNISVPVLLITGSLDEKFCRIAGEMTKRVKNSQWISVENCGHAIHVENPEKFGTIVNEFLSNSGDN